MGLLHRLTITRPVAIRLRAISTARSCRHRSPCKDRMHCDAGGIRPRGGADPALLCVGRGAPVRWSSGTALPGPHFAQETLTSGSGNSPSVHAPFAIYVSHINRMPTRSIDEAAIERPIISSTLYVQGIRWGYPFAVKRSEQRDMPLLIPWMPTPIDTLICPCLIHQTGLPPWRRDPSFSFPDIPRG
jgi:hypothetical protein